MIRKTLGEIIKEFKIDEVKNMTTLTHYKSNIYTPIDYRFSHAFNNSPEAYKLKNRNYCTYQIKNCAVELKLGDYKDYFRIYNSNKEERHKTLRVIKEICKNYDPKKIAFKTRKKRDFSSSGSRRNNSGGGSFLWDVFGGGIFP